MFLFWVVYKALKRNFKINLGASLVVGTRLDRKFAWEIDGKLPEKQVKTPPNTSLMPPPKNRKLLINHPDCFSLCFSFCVVFGGPGGGLGGPGGGFFSTGSSSGFATASTCSKTTPRTTQTTPRTTKNTPRATNYVLNMCFY